PQCAGAREARRRDGSRWNSRDPACRRARARGRRYGARRQGGRSTRPPVRRPASRAVHRLSNGAGRLGRLSVTPLDCRAMIYVCVPVHNEARTVGLVLWKVRQVFTAFAREYQIVACDDGSTDGTGEVLASYARVLPLTVVTHRERQGYA